MNCVCVKATSGPEDLRDGAEVRTRGAELPQRRRLGAPLLGDEQTPLAPVER